MSIPPGAWLARPLGLHLAAALVLALAMVAGFFGVLVAVEAFDPNGLLQSDSEELSTEPVTTAGYLGELAFAAVPALLVCSLLLPVLRAAGSPAPRLAAAAMAVLPLAAFALLIVDSRIEEARSGRLLRRPRPGGDLVGRVDRDGGGRAGRLAGGELLGDADRSLVPLMSHRRRPPSLVP